MNRYCLKNWLNYLGFILKKQWDWTTGPRLRWKIKKITKP